MARELRSDARRSAELVVAAARTAIAEHGLAVSTNEIVKRAGVGPGTFYRRFPSRHALLEAVLLEVVGELLEQARSAAQDPDPWAGFAGLVSALAVAQSENKGLADALAAEPEEGGDEVSSAFGSLRDHVRVITERAQEAGVVRADVTWRDVPFFAGAAAGMSPRCLGLDAGVSGRERVVAVVLAGLRAPGRGALPGESPRDQR
ncbi:TetR/AcrR family transcriptional regulator [Amycolatopsis sp., V23-08]|uniref:TetR/AcrR family transcriptional regulator n=1 Tax=Amycolatopsis heterodermiae TaxID=3110235 RepID=A0ABU5RM17_9PSEU|nr:TetR/AcrR family transcriptional regulator [Amycolatopsis sp., V23-08]MEA5367342.1 TetR/AcrR family transcriptional regulator [Amycolatopsis sp., V23-08]